MCAYVYPKAISLANNEDDNNGSIQISHLAFRTKLTFVLVYYTTVSQVDNNEYTMKYTRVLPLCS